MTDPQIEIRGGAGEFEAAVIGIVLDHMAREEASARAQARSTFAGLSAWVRATPQVIPDQTPLAARPGSR